MHCRQNGLLSRHDIGQFWHVSLIVFQHILQQMITHWHIHICSCYYFYIIFAVLLLIHLEKCNFKLKLLYFLNHRKYCNEICRVSRLNPPL